MLNRAPCKVQSGGLKNRILIMAGGVGGGRARCPSAPFFRVRTKNLRENDRLSPICIQTGGAGTKAERGHSCPQQLANVQRDRRVRKLYFRSTLLRTRMSALRRRPKNLRDPRRLSHTVVQRAPTVRDCLILLHCAAPGALGIRLGAGRPTAVRIGAEEPL